MSWGEQIKKRQMVYGGGSVAAVLLVLGILIVAALLADRYQARWDTTQGKTQSLSSITRVLLKDVAKPLTMTAFVPEGATDRQTIRELLDRYAHENREITFSLVDPERQPLKAKEAGYRFPGNILLEYEGKKQMAERADEDSVTNALRRLLKAERKKVYFLTGHGERDISDGQPGGFQVAKKALDNEGFEVATVNLLTAPQVPNDAAVVIVASPKKPLLAAETQALKAFLNRGGRLLVMLEAFEDAGLKDFLDSYGIGIDDSMILDVNQLSQALGVSAAMPLVAQYGPSKITQDFKNVVTVFPLSRPIFLKKSDSGVTVMPLATTMPSSYAKKGKGWMKTGQANFNPQEDRQGPLTMAGIAEIKVAEKAEKPDKPKEPGAEDEQKTYMVVYGDVDFAANAYFNLFGNGDLFLNTVNFLAKEMKQIMVREGRKAQTIALTGPQMWAMLAVTLVWAPLLMLGAGIWAYRRRRRARK